MDGAVEPEANDEDAFVDGKPEGQRSEVQNSR